MGPGEVPEQALRGTWAGSGEGGVGHFREGGEEENGDNLVCFDDPDTATKYAIEAIKLVDHYRFRAIMGKRDRRPTAPA